MTTRIDGGAVLTVAAGTGVDGRDARERITAALNDVVDVAAIAVRNRAVRG